MDTNKNNQMATTIPTNQSPDYEAEPTSVFDLTDGIAQSITPPDMVEAFGENPWDVDMREEIAAKDEWFQKSKEKMDQYLDTPETAFAGFDMSIAETNQEAVMLYQNDAFVNLHFPDDDLPDFNGISRQLRRVQLADMLFDGEGADSEESFNARLHKHRAEEKDLIAIHENLAENASQAAIFKAGKEKGQTFQQWREGAQSMPGYKPEMEPDLYFSYQEQQARHAELIEPYREDIEAAWTAVKRGNQGSFSETVKDVLAIGFLEAGDEVLPMPDEKDAGQIVFEAYDKLDPDQRNEFLDAMNLFTKSLPKEEKMKLMASVANTFGQTLDELGRSTASRFTQKGFEEYFRDQMTDAFSGPFGMTDEQIEAANAETAAIRDDRLAQKKFVDDFQAMVNGQYQPRTYSSAPSDNILSMRTLEEGLHVTASAAASIAYSITPVIGQGAMFLAMEDSAFKSLRDNSIRAGADEMDASRFADEYKTWAAVPMTGLELIQTYLPFGRVPIANKILTKVGDSVTNGFVRAGMRLGAAGVAQTATEEAQYQIPYLMQEMAVGMGEATGISPAEWYNGVDGAFDGFWNRQAETFVGMMPLGIGTAMGGMNKEARAKAFADASPTMKLAKGYSPEFVSELEEAAKKGPSSLNELLEKGDPNYNPESESAKDATQELAEQLQQQRQDLEELNRLNIFPIIQASQAIDGFQVLDKETGEVIANAPNRAAAMDVAFNHVGIKEADRDALLNEEIDSYLEALELKTSEAKDLNAEFVLDLGTRMDPERMRSELTQDILALEGKKTPDALAQIAKKTAKLERIDDQIARLQAIEKLEGGSGEVSRAIFGEMETDVRGKEKTMIRRMYADSTIMTLVHEDAHAARRTLMQKGILDEVELIETLRAIDAQGAKSRRANYKPFLPDAAAAPTESELDEAFAEFAEVLVMGTRGGKRTKMRDLLNRNLSAIAKSQSRGGKVMKAFIRAYKQLLGMALGRYTVMQKAIREGAIDPEKIDQFRAMLQGTTEQEEFDADVEAESRQYEGLDTEVYDDENPFSIGAYSKSRLQAAAQNAKDAVARMPKEEKSRIGRFWLSMGEDEKILSFPKNLKGKNFKALADEIKSVVPNIVVGDTANGGHPKVGSADITRLSRDEQEFFIFEKFNLVWVDSTSAGGKQAYDNPETRAKASISAAGYQIAQAYAKNTGKQFIQDPSLISETAAPRRWAQMLSSAIRFGETKHLDASDDVAAWTNGKDAAMDVGELAAHEYEFVKSFFPEIESLQFSPDGSKILSDDGSEISRKTLVNLLTGGRDPRVTTIGERTLRRAIASRTAKTEGALIPRQIDARLRGEFALHERGNGNTLLDRSSVDGEADLGERHPFEGIAYSIADASMRETLITDVSRRAKSPEERLKIFQKIRLTLQAGMREVDRFKAFYREKITEESFSGTDLERSLISLELLQEEAAEAHAEELETLKNEESRAVMDARESNMAVLGPDTGKNAEARKAASEARKQAVAKVKEAFRTKREKEKRKHQSKIANLEKKSAALIARSNVSDATAKENSKRKKEVAELRNNFANKKRESRNRLLSSMTMLEGIIAALPLAERGRIGGYTQLAKLDTDESRLKYLKNRVEKADIVIENWLKKTYEADVRKTLDRAMKGRKGGKKPVGKLGAQGHRYFDVVSTVVDLSVAEVETKIESIDKRIADVSNEQISEKMRQRKIMDLLELQQILLTYGALKQKTAAELEAAAIAAANVYQTRRNAWRTVEEERLANVKKTITATLRDLGNPDTAEVQIEKQLNRSNWNILKNGRWGLYSFAQTLEELLGKDSKLAQKWSQQARRAFAARTSGIDQAHKRWKLATESATGLKGRAARIRVYEMNTDQKIEAATSKVITEKIKVPTETFFDAEKRESLGLSKNEIAELERQFERLPDKSRVKNLTLTRTTTAKGKIAKFTEAEAIFLRMAWAQESYQEAMELHGYGQAFQDILDEKISDAGKQVQQFLSDEYADQYEPLRQVFARMFGVDLPQNKNYSPGKFYSQGQDTSADLSGGSFVEGGIMQGFLKDRKNHHAEIRPESAFNVYFNHANNTEHWKAIAELSREMHGVLGNPEVKKALQAKNKRGAQVLGMWLQAIDGNGMNTSNSKIVDYLLTRQSYIALSWKAVTLAKNLVGAAINQAFAMPLPAFIKGYGRLMRGEIDARAMFNSELIQNRLAGGFSPEVRAAIGSAMSEKPSLMNDFLMKGMENIGLADGFATSMGAAIVYDYHYHLAKTENPNWSQDMLHAYGLDKAAEAIAKTAQPVEILDRSILELNSAVLAKVAFVFASEARQKTAMWLNAWMHTIKGNPTKEDIRVLFLSHLVISPLMHAVGQMMRDARDDEDEELFDEKHWNMGGFAAAALTGPLGGMPLVRDIFSGFSGDTGPLARFASSGKSTKQIIDALWDEEDQDFEWYQNKITRVLLGLGARVAVPASLVDQTYDFMKNLLK